MLDYYTGVPGSGKTYRAVDHIYNCFIDTTHKDFGKYKRLYTNINEFYFDYINDFDPETSDEKSKPALLGVLRSSKHDNKATSRKSEQSEEREGDTSDSAIGRDEKAFPLRMDELLVHLEELRTLYLQKEPDTVLVRRAGELGLIDCLFIIDEAHNYFDTKNDTLIWWLSYHRHLHQDITLITQNLSLIYRKYLSFGEFFYRAVPSSLRLRGGVFTYHQFIKYQLYKNSHTGTIKVNFRPEVFALYGSGANTQGKKVIYKFLIIFGFLGVIAFGAFNMFTWLWSSSSDDSAAEKSPQPLAVSKRAPVADLSSTFTVVCVGFECSCFGQTFSLAALNQYSQSYGLVSIDTVSIDDSTVFRTFARNDQFLKEVLHVENNPSSDR